MTIDFMEVLKRVVKYLIEGLAVSIVAIIIPKKRLDLEEIVVIALTAACVFAILDTFIPAAGATSRQALGGAAGVGLFGGLKVI
jgi:ABC-type Co2+ transport system permease subunit